MMFLVRILLLSMLYIINSSNLIGQFTVKMERVNGTLIVPCTVNGLKLGFIFDTGASNVSISLTEALFMLKNNYLKTTDILGTEYYKIANGEIEEGTIVVLREIEIGGYSLYNVNASIIHDSNAPLLLGQSAIKKLGKYEFDYSNKSLRFDNMSKSELIIDKRDNQYYKTVRIGNQVWMAQNLNYVSKSGSYQEENSPTIYGRYYNWKTAINVCPEGWHLPSKNEWLELEAFVKSKYPTTKSWMSESLWDKISGTDDFEFSVWPSGMYTVGGTFYMRRLTASFWTSTAKDNHSAYLVRFYSYVDKIDKGGGGIANGHSVRCLKD